jgi:anti-sigma regulatory factor (Ser/Thr protein kinase)
MTRSADDRVPSRGHAAAVVGSDEQLFAESALFVQAGIDADELVAIGGTPAFQQLMVEEFGDSPTVLFDDGIRLNDKRAPDTLAHVARLSVRAAGRGSGALRVLAQVDYSSDPRAVREFACFESAANLLATAAPTSILCLYDTRRVTPELLRTAACTHPLMTRRGRTGHSDGYVHPHDFVRSLPIPPEPLQDGEPLIAVDEAVDLAGLRHALGEQVTAAIRDREQREDLYLAISEMAANAFRHGGRPISARLWASADRLVCTVSDGGRGVDPLYGYWPAHGEDLSRGGMGLWLARKLCDHVDIDNTGHGTTVRLATALR